jgi:hypothetical protein
MSDEILLDLQKRLSHVERIIMEPVVTRRDVKILIGFGMAVIIIGILMLLGEIYLMSQVNHVYSLL